MRRWKKILLFLLLTLALLGGALTWRIHTWGNPLPRSYKLVSVLPGNPGGDRAWIYENTATAERVIASDTDQDGTVDTVLTEGSSLKSFSRPAPDDPETRWLIVCLDGIPYEEILSLWEEGYFREYFRPVPLIAPFPSESEVALTESVHAAPVPGYEHKFFDRAANRVRGGLLTTFQETNIPYLKIFDYDMGGIFKGIAYLIPRKSYHADLGRMRNRFLASDQQTYLAHIASADSLYHIFTREEMRLLLIDADAMLRQLYFDSGGKLRITVYADHGNSLAPSHNVPLPEHLAENGWRLRGSLEQPGDVVVPAYGLIAFSAVYVAPEEAERLAPVIATLEGVDLVVRPMETAAAIESPRGSAHLEWKPDGSAYRYQTTTGDPLKLEPVLDQLAKEKKIDSEGWVSDSDLFTATLDHDYPDPGSRLRTASINHVLNRADIFISYQPGYFYGAGIFLNFVDILSTHGSLDRAQTLGFAMSTDGPLPRTVRSGELLPPDFKTRKDSSE
jgi:hypothetical protein